MVGSDSGSDKASAVAEVFSSISEAKRGISDEDAIRHGLAMGQVAMPEEEEEEAEEEGVVGVEMT